MGRELCEILQNVSDNTEKAKVNGGTEYQSMITAEEAMVLIGEAFQSGMDYALSNCMLNVNDGSNS